MADKLRAMRIEEEIKQKALSLGFDIVGITSAENIDSKQIEEYKNWLNAGSNGRMAYLAKNVEQRFSPVSILPDAKSVICVGLNYKLPQSAADGLLQIASYALYPDYHKFIREKLTILANFLKLKIKNFKFKICVDSLPIAEKALAARAGLGFIGKNRLLINPKLGSFLLLGELITNLPLETNEPKLSSCGDCRKCIDACPTDALSEEQFDARRCISYLTIEHKGRISPELKDKMDSHLFGCEQCLLACPYNEKSPLCEKQKYGFTAREIKLEPDIIIGWSKTDFENFAADSAMKRTGFRRMKRNVLICRKNAE
ncbi:MAG: tRNA epoxyqueuosine(34) reductase QueG [Phycisphaerae bacterium]